MSILDLLALRIMAPKGLLILPSTFPQHIRLPAFKRSKAQRKKMALRHSKARV